ncbi:hypothetical protein QBC40DRAFT_87070 [Triangularia verruculosa]|uniref:Uncharacterized protein n=1 Tax=Triangularia verruculosa TaxID=2587418 RepID=A0AAN7AS18_9PEZI|nr:hypothetical protein QBC40DRAFT_87070 [Triangularia verruculosa]
MEQGTEESGGEEDWTMQVEEKILEEQGRYIYVNWEVDILNILPHEITIFAAAALVGKVRRLVVAGRSELILSSFLVIFGKVEEIEIYCEDKFREWLHLAMTPNLWPCGMRNVRLIDGRDVEGEVETVRLVDLEKYVDDEDRLVAEVWDCEEVVDALRESGVDGCVCHSFGYQRTFDSDGADADDAGSHDDAGCFVPPLYNGMVGCTQCYSVRGPVVERLLNQKRKEQRRKGGSEDI